MTLITLLLRRRARFEREILNYIPASRLGWESAPQPFVCRHRRRRGAAISF
ncbi:MAG TPA: hypothetical protein PLT34_07220 [Muribaculaceae bacterium]|nr:hypothetical protein [Muribaculaceae bacterium]